MNIREFGNVILLTGAGFTKNFGGFLSHEMEAQIFNNPAVQASEPLRKLLQENYDFEEVYSIVVGSNPPRYSEEDRHTIARAVETAYRTMDDATRGWVFNSDSPYPVNWYGVGKLLSIFNGSNPAKWMFFTLNQDLFMERKLGYRPPGAPWFPNEFYNLHGRELRQEEFVTLPSGNIHQHAEQALNNHVGLHYIKLHGSYGWRSSDGSHRLVVGKNKAELINGEPLLKWYFDLFRNAVWSGGKKILIIGYGFGDKHINDVLLKGIQDHGLKIFIISTMTREGLRDRLYHGHYYAREILDSIRGYYPYELKDIFPSDQSETIHFKQIREALRSA